MQTCGLPPAARPQVCQCDHVQAGWCVTHSTVGSRRASNCSVLHLRRLVHGSTPGSTPVCALVSSAWISRWHVPCASHAPRGMFPYCAQQLGSSRRQSTSCIVQPRHHADSRTRTCRALACLRTHLHTPTTPDPSAVGMTLTTSRRSWDRPATSLPPVCPALEAVHCLSSPDKASGDLEGCHSLLGRLRACESALLRAMSMVGRQLQAT